ncbi:sigma-70 family RNA polymerase sigma factor [Candidatus Palauibacter sp.]|uniref:sigma-70 family RNA polymerase sigma factor n=1 Tax=Candidatus Palauibacter sp. TaxID=3101350 RepID=UPI003B58B8FE
MPAWSEFQSRLRRYVGGRVDPAWADDVTGDILLRLVERQDSLGQARDPLAWAYRVAANVIADHYRRRTVEMRALERVGAEVDTADRSLDTQDHETMRRDLEACLMPFALELPPKYAEALILTSFQGLSQVEAARRLGLSASGMKSRVQRARGLLKRRLLDCCDFELDRRGGVMDMRCRRAPADREPTVAGGRAAGQ